MNIITKYPVLVNPMNVDINDYKLNDPKFDLPGSIQNVSVGDFVVKGTNPVFDNDKEVTTNEFMYLKEIDLNDEVLTPMDEYLYSGRNYSDGKFDFGEFDTYGDVFENLTGEDLLSNPYSKPKTNALNTSLQTQTISITPSQYAANVKNIKGGPTAQEQIEKAKKEGKFWNSVKGGWDKFKTSENGQIMIQSGASYVLDKLGGTNATNTTTDVSNTTTPPSDSKAPMSKTTKTILMVGGVAVIGVIIYMIAKKK